MVTYWGSELEVLASFAAEVLARIEDNTIGTTDGMVWFRVAISKVMPKTLRCVVGAW